LPQITVKELLEAGIHYGHRASRWNPKMKPYIYGKRKLIHIVDIRETIRGLLTACKFLEKVVSQGKDVVFVSAKRQAKAAIKAEADRCSMHYVNERWIGGTLTNFKVIRSRVSRLDELEKLEQSGELDKFSKKEGAALRRELAKIRRNLGGIRRMDRLPGALVVVDPRREKIAVAEANQVGIPTVCLADTDCNPDVANVLIPGNDDAMRAIGVVLRKLSDAVIAGLQKRTAPVEPPAEAPAPRLREAARAEEAKPAARERAPERVAPPSGGRRHGGPLGRRAAAAQPETPPEKPASEPPAPKPPAAEA
jgi:small subunit ribosomal protein S2